MHLHKRPLMPYTMNFTTLLASIDQLPWIVEEDDNKLISKQSNEEVLFRGLLKKLLGDNKQKQLNFLMHQARLINRKAYINTALRTVSKPPPYSTLTKNQRRPFEHLYSLFENILLIAAGSASEDVQRNFLEDRWLLIHKAALKQKFTWNSLEQTIESLPNPMK